MLFGRRRAKEQEVSLRLEDARLLSARRTGTGWHVRIGQTNVQAASLGDALEWLLGRSAETDALAQRILKQAALGPKR